MVKVRQKDKGDRRTNGKGWKKGKGYRRWMVKVRQKDK